MKPHLYQTNQNHIMAEKSVFANVQKNDWISTVTVSEKPVNTNFNGFGVAITGSSCYELSTMPEEQRAQFLSDIYGSGGLGLSMARLSIGSSDYSTSVYSYCDTPGDTELKTFSIDPDREFVIPMIKEAIAHNPDLKFLASPWSPPGWFKTGGLLSYGYMREKYIDCYADYFIKFIKAYGAEGIKISAVTPQNEPETHQRGTSVACIWTPDAEAKFVIALKEKMRQNGIDTQIWLYDHCFVGWPRVLWTLNEYPQLAECADAVAFHYYEGGIELADNIRAVYPNMKWNFTEGGPRLFDNYDTDWGKWSYIMAQSLSHGCESFFGWNLILDEDGGPNIGPFFCAGLATLNSQTGELTYSGQYHAFKHFSKFIKRGAEIYSVKISEDFSCPSYGFPDSMGVPVVGVAADNTDGSHIVVLVNSSKKKRQTQYFYANKWWYAELLPNSVSTLVFNG